MEERNCNMDLYDFNAFPMIGSSLINEKADDTLKNLNSCEKVEITPEFITKHMHDYPQLKHIKSNAKAYAWISPKNKNEIVALLAVEEKDPESIWIQMLMVMPGYRRRGFGKTLLITACEDLGAKYLSVNENNKAAISLYTRYGFDSYEQHGPMIFMRRK